MEIREAITIILCLAEDNMLDLRDEDTHDEAIKQREALSILEDYLKKAA